MTPELRLLLAGLLTGVALTLALGLVGFLWWLGREADAELRGTLQGGWVPLPGPRRTCPPVPPRTPSALPPPRRHP